MSFVFAMSYAILFYSFLHILFDKLFRRQYLHLGLFGVLKVAGIDCQQHWAMVLKAQRY